MIIEMFSLLEKQCQGRAKAMISSLYVINQTYQQAKRILVNAFAGEMPQTSALMREITN